MTDDTTFTKVCTKCGKELPATIEFYARRGTSIRNECKQCQKEYKRIYYQNNKTRLQALHADYYRANSMALRAKSKAWREANPERKRINDKAWQQANPERKKAIHDAWNDANREKVRASSHRRRAREAQAPGEWGPADIKAMLRNQRNKCWYCLESIEGGYHIEHRVPLSRGGTNELGNLVLACPTCNLSKHMKTPDEWIGRLL